MYIHFKNTNSYHRKKLLRQLLANRYVVGKVPEPSGEAMHALTDGPQVDSVQMEHDLKRFNAGEAFYSTEDYATEVSMLGVKSFHHYWPNSTHPERSRSLEDMREQFYDWLLCGIGFQYGSERRPSYGICQLIDFAHPESNTFRVHQDWQGCQANGFG